MIRFAQLVRRLTKVSRAYCMEMWSDYVDESYNMRSFCVGGWLAVDYSWANIKTAWKQRIDYENRMSAKKGFPPISRYHATDCANLKNEFAESKGWSIPRQIRMSKRLCGIVGQNRPAGIVIGGGIADFKKYFPLETKDFKKGLYRLSFMMHVIEVGYAMRDFYPEDRVTVYHDQSREFGPVAREAFDERSQHYMAIQIFCDDGPDAMARLYSASASGLSSLRGHEEARWIITRQ